MLMSFAHSPPYLHIYYFLFKFIYDPLFKTKRQNLGLEDDPLKSNKFVLIYESGEEDRDFVTCDYDIGNVNSDDENTHIPILNAIISSSYKLKLAALVSCKLNS